MGTTGARQAFRCAAVPTRFRLGLAGLVALLPLLAQSAAGGSGGAGGWVSLSSRGIQVANGFELAVVFRDDPAEPHFWPAFALAPGGDAIYALRQPPPHPQHRTELVRLTGGRGEPARAEAVLTFDDLADAGLWDPGVDLSDAVIGEDHGGHLPVSGGGGQLAVAPGGDVFLVAGAWGRDDPLDRPVPPRGVSVLVRRVDGSVAKVLTVRELVASGVLRADPERVVLAVSAAASDRLWLAVETFSRPLERPRFFNQVGRASFYSVVDPNADGDWSDRTVSRLALPGRIPLGSLEPSLRQRWFPLPIVAEPGARSFFLPVLAGTGEYRVYRIADRDADGDALDPGEAERILTDETGADGSDPPLLAARPGGGLVAARLTRRTRVSLVSASGRVTDVVRAVDGRIESVLAGQGREVHVVVQARGEQRSQWVVYRLSRRGGGVTPPAPPPPPPLPGAAPARGGVPLLAFAIERYDTGRGEIMVIGADGKGLRRLVPGRYNHGFCASADGRKMAYFSDEEAPQEWFLYVANADGSGPQKVTEDDVGFWCRFSDRWLLLFRQSGAGSTFIRHDLRSGKESTLLEGVDRVALSPDGNRLAFVGGLDFGAGFLPKGRETLELVDVGTAARRRLDGPLPPGRGFFGGSGGSALKWSPDGHLISYAVGLLEYPVAKTGRYSVYLKDTSDAPARLLLRVEGGPPTLSWSPSGRWLLVCVAGKGSEAAEVGCTGERPKRPAKLFLVDAESGESRVVAEGRLVFAGWRRTEDSFAYATGRAVYAVSVGGEARLLVRAPEDGWPGGNWFGFSPDDRYIGIGSFSGRLAVLDVASGKTRVVLRKPKGGYVEYPKWWP